MEKGEDMKIYDMHIHTGFGEPKPGYLIEKMEEAGVYGGALISACPKESTIGNLLCLDYKERIDNLLRWTRESDRLFPVLYVHPHEKYVKDKIKDAAERGVAAFKMICDNYAVDSRESLEVIEAIERTEKPIIFHTGILWSGTDTSKYNRPVGWECMLNFKRIKFSMGHCSWPWHDECIAVYGKFLNRYNVEKSSEMFFDITPGTPEIYRRELLTKLFCVGYDVNDNIMFGTDSISTEYDPRWVKRWLKLDGSIMDELGVAAEVREKIYCNNFMRFLNGGDVSHSLPQMNK